MKKLFLYIPVTFLLLTAASCSKDDTDIIPDYLYGSWKASYGDTIIFSRINGSNFITADLAWAAVHKPPVNYEFTYRNEKLGIKGRPYYLGSDYVFCESFKWIQTGQSFEILKPEWFPFSSSGNTYYTFTKLP